MYVRGILCLFRSLATSFGIKIIDEGQQEMSLDRGMQFIIEAIDLSQSDTLSTTFHQSVYSELAGRKAEETLH